MYSQGTQTLAQTNNQDLLHCIVAGHGERITLVSPYQRLALQAGYPGEFDNPDTKEKEDVHIPPQYTFKDLSESKVPDDINELNFFKPLHQDIAPGDCVHIPAYWWYQIRTKTPRSPNKNAPQFRKDKFKKD